MAMIGITGGVGAGKSTVLKCFRELGARVLEADTVAHELYRPGTAVYQKIIDKFGGAITNQSGEINRQALAAKVFHNPDLLQWLNSTTHPAVKQKIVEVQRQQPQCPLFCAIPLLYEVGWEKAMDCVICVWCDQQTQQQRLLDRGWSEEEITKRKLAQWSMEEKSVKADYVIINIDGILVLQEQCEKIYTTIINTEN